MYLTKRYVNYIRSDKWKKKREDYFRVYGRKCQACKTTRGPIHVHHMDYRRLGDEPLSDLMGLCQECHRRVTFLYRRNRRYGLRRITLAYVRAKSKGLKG